MTGSAAPYTHIWNLLRPKTQDPRPETRYLRPEDFAISVYEAVRRVPYGRVASYGAIAAAAGRPRAARAVGRALRELPEGSAVPWWRVVNARGELTIPRSSHARPLQRALLEDDGVIFNDAGRVDMRRFAWDPAAEDEASREEDR